MEKQNKENSKNNVFTIKNNSDKVESDNVDMENQTKSHTKKYRTLLKNGDKQLPQTVSMEDTRNNCRLLVRKQIALNNNYDVDDKNELYVGSVFTEQELNDKVLRVIKSGKFSAKQKVKILNFFKHIKKTGWFDKFIYRGFLCVVTLDEMGRWRIFVKYQYNSQRSIFESDEEDYGYCDNSARCYVTGFPLGCWDYGEKLGLDDFIGMPTLIESYWDWDYFSKSKKQRYISEKRHRMFRDFRSSSLLDIRVPTRMVKLLVDRMRKDIMRKALPLDE